MKNNSSKFEVSAKQYDLEILCVLVIGPLLLGVINAVSMVFFKYNLLG
jgi:hypothetical protein